MPPSRRPFLLSLLLLGSCSSPPLPDAPGEGPEGAPAEMEAPLELTDAAGHHHLFPRPPRRILSLVPSASLTLQALGAQHLLVGRTDHDTAASLSHLPSVGGGLYPSLELLVALEPDLVLRFAGDSDMATPQRLEKLGIPHFALRPDGVEDVRRIILEMGAISGRRGEAALLLAVMDSTLLEIRRRLQGVPPRRAAYLLGGSPPWVAGPGTYIHELLEAAGGENAFSDLGQLYGPISPEELLVRGVEVVLAAGGVEVSLPSRDLLLRRVGASLEIPGPHLAREAMELARILHPEAFR